ncbi:MAG: hypothetical protein KBE09_01170 [Candidatus Pacebacteria bacterium]|nr:hypothetical protein [Candidatus Paceibacterota bacterium]
MRLGLFPTPALRAERAPATFLAIAIQRGMVVVRDQNPFATTPKERTCSDTLMIRRRWLFWLVLRAPTPAAQSAPDGMSPTKEIPCRIAPG